MLLNTILQDQEYISNKAVVSEIKNAWDNSCIVDNNGNIWINDTSLHSILRTSRDNAKYYIQEISEQNKREYEGVTYIRGNEIIGIIDYRLQNSGEIRKEKNLRYSGDIYLAIRDAKEVKLLRAEYYESIKNYAKNLKKERIKKFVITCDELTNDILATRLSEFSHTRSCSIYPALINNIHSGLVVNKSTHDIITSNSVNDEDELFDLCKRLRWNTDWYEAYIDYLKMVGLYS